jgi:hypothetical protein
MFFDFQSLVYEKIGYMGTRCRVNSLYILEYSPNPFHTLEIYPIPSIPLKLQLDPFHAPAVIFPLISLLSLVTNVFYALTDLDLNISLKMIENLSECTICAFYETNETK